MGMNMNEVVGQRPDMGYVAEKPRKPSRVARKVRETVLGTAEQARASHAAQKAVRREEARPALGRASRAAHDAEGSLGWLRIQLEDVSAAWMLGDVGEDAVEAIEAQIEEAERDLRRYSAAVRGLERQVGIIRDGYGNDLSALRG